MATIILVHGTFASGPEAGEKWWQQDSPFERDLKQLVTGVDGRLAIERLIWDGANSERSRREAGTQLKRRLEALEHAGERYGLIGHSHGGSVILAALLQSAYGRVMLPGLSRWLTVGTPFISFARHRVLFSRVGLLGKAVYISLLTFLSLFATIAWLDHGKKDTGLAAFITAMCFLVWLFAHLIMGWIADRRLARSGAGLMHGAAGSLFLPDLGLVSRLAYGLMLSLTAVFLTVLWFSPSVASGFGARMMFSAGTLAIMLGFHLLVAWLSRRWRARRLRNPKSDRNLLVASFARWLPLRHPQDEAVEGLGRLHAVAFPIFGRDFAVAPLMFAAVIAFPIVVTLTALSPGLMNWIARGITGAYAHTTLFSSTIVQGGKLVGEGGDLAANIKFLLTAPVVLLFGSNSPDTQAILLLVFGPGIYFLGSLLLVAFARVAAMGLSNVASQMLDGLAWRQIRASAFGGDTLGEASCVATSAPAIAAAAFPALPEALAAEISRVADGAAGEAIVKLRASLNRLAFADDGRTRSDLVSEYLTWDELIHTAYFNVPRFNKLVAYTIATSDGFTPTAAFLADPDYAVVARWHDAIALSGQDRPNSATAIGPHPAIASGPGVLPSHADQSGKQG